MTGEIDVTYRRLIQRRRRLALAIGPALMLVSSAALLGEYLFPHLRASLVCINICGIVLALASVILIVAKKSWSRP
jgi:hypothetical protein